MSGKRYRLPPKGPQARKRHRVSVSGTDFIASWVPSCTLSGPSYASLEMERECRGIFAARIKDLLQTMCVHNDNYDESTNKAHVFLQKSYQDEVRHVIDRALATDVVTQTV